MAIAISTADGIGATGTTTRTLKFQVTASKNGIKVASATATPSAGKWSVKWKPGPLALGDYVANAGSQRKPFTVGGPPGGGWPFPSSPMRKPVGSNPQLDPNSAALVSAFNGQGPWGNVVIGTELTRVDWGRPYYVAKDTDPTVTVHGGLGNSWSEPSCEGNVIHVPPNARPAGGSYWQALDGGVVIEQPNGDIYSAWRSEDPVSGRAYEWAKISGNGDGVPGGVYGNYHAGICQARLGPRQGQLIYEELTGGLIPHALFAEVRNWHRRDWPGWPGDSKDPERGGYTPSTNAPPMGGHFWLDYSPDEIDSLQVPPWKRTILHAFAAYGFYVYDNGSAAHALLGGSDIPELVQNRPNRWVAWAQANGIPGHFDSQAGKTIYSLDIQSGVDWSRLKLLAP